MIHGKSCSIGCLAMGDEAAEDLFTLAADAGIEHVTVIVSPIDFRKNDAAAHDGLEPPWTTALYEDLAQRLAAFGLSDRGER